MENKEIIKNEEDNFYNNYEILLYGSAIVDFINFVKSNQTFNTKDIEVELQKKKEWFNENVKPI